MALSRSPASSTTTDRYEAERAAARIAGVVGVANDIKVRLPEIDVKPAFRPGTRDGVADNITAVVRNGWIDRCRADAGMNRDPFQRRESLLRDL